MNYFSPPTVAERYAKGRPHYHAHTIARLVELLKIDKKLDKALDMACGTGLSTAALLPIATNVFGTDSSPEMLKIALNKVEIIYSMAPAESQPFEDHVLDLITVASGVHWFDMEPFLHEVKRILKPTGKLVLYDNYFLSKMEGNPTFSTWYPEVYLDKFPAPPRNSGYDWSNENLNQKELKLEHAEEFENEIPFTKSDLILYFTTQSNITAVIEAEKMTYEEVENWLDEQLTPFFTKENQVRNIVFGNWLKIIGVVKKV